MKIRLEMDDGRVFEAEANDKTWSCLADRIRFEKQFATSWTVMEAWRTLFDEDEDGKRTPRPGADLSIIREEYTTFLYWCELRRRAENVPDWVEVIEHGIECGPIGEAELDPTGTASS